MHSGLSVAGRDGDQQPLCLSDGHFVERIAHRLRMPCVANMICGVKMVEYRVEERKKFFPHHLTNDRILVSHELGAPESEGAGS